MQRFLQPITEHYCDFLAPNTVQDWGFAPVSELVDVGEGCEPRCLLFSFAA
jgi:hypothetical protein